MLLWTCSLLRNNQRRLFGTSKHVPGKAESDTFCLRLPSCTQYISSSSVGICIIYWYSSLCNTTRILKMCVVFLPLIIMLYVVFLVGGAVSPTLLSPEHRADWSRNHTEGQNIFKSKIDIKNHTRVKIIPRVKTKPRSKIIPTAKTVARAKTVSRAKIVSI